MSCFKKKHFSDDGGQFLNDLAANYIFLCVYALACVRICMYLYPSKWTRHSNFFYCCVFSHPFILLKKFWWNNVCKTMYFGEVTRWFGVFSSRCTSRSIRVWVSCEKRYTTHTHTRNTQNWNENTMTNLNMWPFASRQQRWCRWIYTTIIMLCLWPIERRKGWTKAKKRYGIEPNKTKLNEIEHWSSTKCRCGKKPEEDTFTHSRWQVIDAIDDE